MSTSSRGMGWARLVFALIFVSACGAIQFLSAAAPVLCDQATKEEPQEIRDMARLGLEMVASVLDGGEIPVNLDNLLEEQVSALRPASRRSLLSTIHSLRRRISAEVGSKEWAKEYAVVLRECSVGLQPLVGLGGVNA